jgi:hypothetical protein
MWAVAGATEVAAESAEFMHFLKCGPKRGSMASILAAWSRGLTDALHCFKHATATGRVSLLPWSCVPTLRTPIEFRVRTDRERDSLLLTKFGQEAVR